MTPSPALGQRLLSWINAQRVTEGTLSGGRVARAAWWVALLLFLVVGVATELLPFLAREVPAEADDSYVRIAHAVRIAQCPTLKCPALTDLRQELLTPAALSDYHAWDVISRALLLLSPLHDAALLGLRGLGVPLESGHDLLAMVSAVITVLGFALWARVLFGPGAAALALLLLMAMIPRLPGHGLLFYSPTTLATGLGMLAWAGLARWGSRAAPLMAGLIPVMLTAHLLGKVWAVVTVAGFLWHARYPLTRAQGGWLGVSVLLVLGAFLVPLLLPHQDVPAPTGALHRDVLQVVAWNLPKLREVVVSLVLFFRHELLLLALLSVGFLSREPGRRGTWLFWGGMLSALMAVSLVNHHPGFSGTLLGRVTLPWLLVLLGVAAHGLVTWSWSRRGWARGVLVVQAAVLVALLPTLAHQGLAVSRDLPRLLQHKSVRHDYRVVPGQVARLAAGCGRVAYEPLTVMFAYFSHGAYGCGAVALTPQGLERSLLPGVTHVAAWGPFREDKGRLPLPSGQGVGIAGAARVEVTWEGSGGGVIVVAPGGAETRLVVPAGVSRMPLTVGVGVTLRAEGGGIFLSGVRVGGGELRWPWDEGVVMTVPDAKSGTRRVTFASQGLWTLDQRRARVVDDQGSTVLAVIE